MSAATGITKNVLYGLTRTLTEHGLVERVDGADGAVGLRIAEAEVAAEPAQSAGDGALGAEESETPRRRRAGRKKPEETAAESASGPGGAP